MGFLHKSGEIFPYLIINKERGCLLKLTQYQALTLKISIAMKIARHKLISLANDWPCMSAQPRNALTINHHQVMKAKTGILHLTKSEKLIFILKPILLVWMCPGA